MRHSQVKENSYHSSFYFWPQVDQTSRYQPFWPIRNNVYIRSSESQCVFSYDVRPTSRAETLIGQSRFLFFAHRIDLTILHSTVYELPWGYILLINVPIFSRIVRNSKIKYTMYSTIRNFLSLVLVHMSLLQSGWGLGIIDKGRDIHVFCH